jgi:hypothetical protein
MVDRTNKDPREKRMEIAPVVPEWLTWLVAIGVGVLAVALLTRSLEAVLDLDRG